MPKKRSKADQRKILSIFAKRQRISVAELKKRLKSDGDSAEHPSVLLLPQDDVLVLHDTSNELGDSQEFPTPSSNNALHLAQAGASAREVGREGAGEGVEAVREVGQGRVSESSIRATRGSESTRGVHADTGVFSPPRARGGTRGGSMIGGARGGARGHGRGSGGGAIGGSARGGCAFTSPPRAGDGVQAAREAMRKEVVFSPLRAREGMQEAREAMRKDGV
jgi:hypothetical protein